MSEACRWSQASAMSFPFCETHSDYHQTFLTPPTVCPTALAANENDAVATDDGGTRLKNHIVSETASNPDDSTPPVSRAIWKSILSATGGFGCERQVFYREVVRDERGYRLDFGMDESPIFGIAIDRMQQRLLEARLRGEAPDVDKATDEGYGKARVSRTRERWADEDWALLKERLHLAGEKYVGLWPNHIKTNGDPEDPTDFTPPGDPIDWLIVPGWTLEPQAKLTAPDVVGGRGMVGKPDWVYRDDAGQYVAWADVKALNKSGTYPAKWMAGEAVTYDYLLAVNNSGSLPIWHTYLEYRRVAKPYWAIISAPVGERVVALARSYFARWEVALDLADPDVLSFSPRSCATCNFRETIPQLNYGGCPIGEAVMNMAPPVDESTGDPLS